MSPKRILRIKPVRNIHRVKKAGPINVSRAEFETVVKLLNQCGNAINELRREIHAICRDLAAEINQHRRELQTQFTRIAQIQQELDDIKRKR